LIASALSLSDHQRRSHHAVDSACRSACVWQRLQCLHLRTDFFLRNL